MRQQGRSDRKARANPRGRARAWIILFPIAIAVVLNWPNLGLGYFWDDLYFLKLAGSNPGSNLLPDPGATFYRPIPLGLYFPFLRWIDPVSGLLGHVVNLTLLAAAIGVLMTLVSQLGDRRAGLFSGLLLAGFAHVWGLVAWTSGSQDLFALFFLSCAFLLRHQNRDWAALACAAAALLCKETALAAFPALMLWDKVVGRPWRRPPLQIAGYAGIVLAWAILHPGIHLLAQRGFRSGATRYIGLEQPGRWGLYAVRYVATLLNLPAPGLEPSWWSARAPYGLGAIVILLLGLRFLDRPGRLSSAPSAPVARLGLLVAVPTLLLPTVLVRHWAPYLASISALGVAMALGPELAKRSRLVAHAALGVFLLLGIWTRGTWARREPVLTERLMAEGSRSVKDVRSNFQRLFPSLPPKSQVIISFGNTGIRGIQLALIDGQALSQWYRDPSIHTMRIRDLPSSAGPEYLVRIADDLDVIAIDPVPLRARSATERPPDLPDIDPTVLGYARTLAASGNTDRAIRILESLNEIEGGDLISYNRRLAASMLLAAGRDREADSILASTPSFPRETALRLVLRLVADPSPSERLDRAAFPALGLSDKDPETIRWIMRELSREGSWNQAGWFALQLNRIRPGDPESAAVLERVAQLGMTPQREPARGEMWGPNSQTGQRR